jgi:hypothetical protein
MCAVNQQCIAGKGIVTDVHRAYAGFSEAFYENA